MKISDFDYILPNQLIAQSPVSPRDHSRLLILDKKSGKIEHKRFDDIFEYLDSSDLIILNNTKVIPARLLGHKEITHGKVELLLHRQLDESVWEGLGRNLKIGGRIIFDNSNLIAVPEEKRDELYKIRFNMSGSDLHTELEKIGLTPIPPYIRNGVSSESDRISYQTVYAKKRGSVAAPTAGLHFTKKLLSQIEKKDVGIDYVTLHVGLGTFAPVKTDNILDHKMHREFFEINTELIDRIKTTKQNGGRVIAIGTTTARVLESVFSSTINYLPADASHQAMQAGGDNTGGSVSGWTDIFIYPGYKFRCVDSLITNFHLPKSTLLLLVSALAGINNIKRAYTEAIKLGYRFYSYGDAMLIK
jgi:S-adenosylmethionine:tRNA ribosyltransferase-isomerase